MARLQRKFRKNTRGPDHQGRTANLAVAEQAQAGLVLARQRQDIIDYCQYQCRLTAGDLQDKRGFATRAAAQNDERITGWEAMPSRMPLPT